MRSVQLAGALGVAVVDACTRLRLLDILRRHHIQARSHMTMINLALMTAEGLGTRLDPTLQLNGAALSYLAEALGMTAAAGG